MLGAPGLIDLVELAGAGDAPGLIGGGCPGQGFPARSGCAGHGQRRCPGPAGPGRPVAGDDLGGMGLGHARVVVGAARMDLGDGLGGLVCSCGGPTGEEGHHSRYGGHRAGGVLAAQGIGGVGQGGGVGRTVLRVLGQHGHDQRADRLRDGLRQRRRRVVDLGQGDRDLGLTGERSVSHQAFVADHAQGVDVRGAGGLLPSGLFGGQVLGRAHDLTGGGQRDLVRQAGDAEVGDLHPSLGSDQQVARLHIPVHQSLCMGGGQGPGRLGHDVQGPVR